MLKKFLIASSLILMTAVLPAYAQTKSDVQAEGEQVPESEAVKDEVLTVQEYIDRLLVKELKNPDISDRGNTTDSELEAIRKEYDSKYFVADDSFMIAALLYKETGEQAYKKDAEEHLKGIEKIISEGGGIDIVRRKSLYYGMVSYLRTDKSVDYKLCGTLMKIIMDEAVVLLNEDVVADSDATDAATKAHILLLANEVTSSPEYLRRAEAYLQYAEDEGVSEFIRYAAKKAKISIPD